MMGLAAKRSRVPVIFNCSHSSFDGVVELTEAAEAAGAAAVLVMPPYFFTYTQTQIVDFYRAGGRIQRNTDAVAALQSAPVYESAHVRDGLRTSKRWNSSRHQRFQRR